MMKKYRKSLWPVTGIMVTIGALLFVIVIVLVFFYFFKFHITLTMMEQYVWNKVQEVPLSLLSMDIGDESFVSRMNKVYYLGDSDEKEELKNEVDDIVTKQLLLGAFTRRPYTFLISVCGISLNKEVIEAGDCECERLGGIPGGPFYECSAGCGPNEGKDCCVRTIAGDCKAEEGDVTLCFSTKKIYSGGFPFPLTFNTINFVDSISYEIVQFEY